MYANVIRKKMGSVPNFTGVYSRDTLPERISLPMGVIINTDESNKPGEHWVAIHIDESGIGEYFDSYGLPPMHREFWEFLLEHAPGGFFYNNIPLQCSVCVTCGEFCVAYLKLRLRGHTYCDFISLFSRNTLKNDSLVKRYFNLIK